MFTFLSSLKISPFFLSLYPLKAEMMTTLNVSSPLPTKSFLPHRPPPRRQISFGPVFAVHSTDPKKSPESFSRPAKWSLDSWKSMKALQLPEYPDQKDLDSVLETLSSYPPIVFAGEARKLEEKLGQAAMGQAFMLQGGDCAESFKEFNADNIRDTFRVLLQMGVVLMFGGQMPIIKV